MELLLIYLWLQIGTITSLLVFFGLVLSIIAVLAVMMSGNEYKIESFMTGNEIRALRNEFFEKHPKENFYGFTTLLEKVTQKTVTTVSVVKKYFIIGIAAVVEGALIPSKTDIAILVGASIAFDLVDSPEGKKVGVLLRGKANELLDAEISKLNPKK